MKTHKEKTRRHAGATVNNLFSAKRTRPPVGSEWAEIIGAENKSRLDAQINKTLTGGLLSAAEALYWHTLIQERMRPCPTHLLLAVARSIRDGRVMLKNVVDETNTLRPDAARGKKQLKQVREIAEDGGRATAHYSDTDVTNAFTDYKKRNPNKGAWDAANALIRKGQPLAKWKGITSSWNRIKRIAEGLGVSVEDWFAEL